MSPESSPLVSVVLPVWNGERYLSAAVESILSQSYQNFELIVVNDGSDDGSRAIVLQHAAVDARVKLIDAPHRGLVASLNLGCDTARGEYIARLDCDDVALPLRIELQVAHLQRHDRVALLGSAFQYIGPSGERTAVVVHPPTDNVSIRQRLKSANCFCHSAVMMRADAFRRVGGYRPVCTEAQDYDLWMRLGDDYEAANLPAVLVLYRVHPAQVSLTKIERQAMVALAVRVATATRRRTGRDPLADCERIDGNVLRGLGVSEPEIETQLVNAYMNCLAAMPGLGLAGVALDALRQVMTHTAVAGALEHVRASG
jgi:glycosyltransferase involved in cell wall biosynthesis